METQQNLRAAFPTKQSGQKATVADRIDIWLSTSRTVDGLWVGSTDVKPEPGLARVEEALRLIKDHDPLHYARITGNLERIWVDLLPDARASYAPRLNACKLDERFVLLETTTPQQIASCIVHEATHARLERWGISYADEKARSRIEAICLRRELNFVGKLPQNEPFREEIARMIEWYSNDHEFFSDMNSRQRWQQGMVEALRHLGTPDWIISILLKLRAVISGVHRLANRFR